MKPGDVVSIPPEVKHWHGAAKDSWFSHLALSAPVKGGGTEWCEPVDDKTYDALYLSGFDSKIKRFKNF